MALLSAENFGHHHYPESRKEPTPHLRCSVCDVVGLLSSFVSCSSVSCSQSEQVGLMGLEPAQPMTMIHPSPALRWLGHSNWLRPLGHCEKGRALLVWFLDSAAQPGGSIGKVEVLRDCELPHQDPCLFTSTRRLMKCSGRQTELTQEMSMRHILTKQEQKHVRVVDVWRKDEGYRCRFSNYDQII